MVPEEISSVEKRLGDFPEIRLRLSELANEVDRHGSWPTQSMELIRRPSMLAPFFAQETNVEPWSDWDLLALYYELGQSCLTTAFILTQWHAAQKRLLNSTNREAFRPVLERLAKGEIWTTVGISHLTTSRQHLAVPILRATEVDGGFRLEGTSPWVTGGAHADEILVGATLADQKQILLLVSANASGMKRFPGQSLVALSASCTDRIDFESVFVPGNRLVDGPEENLLRRGKNGAGGLQTSILALALARRAAEALREQAVLRDELREVSDRFSEEIDRLLSETFAHRNANAGCSLEELRQQCNSIALRATQAALAAHKGAGFVASHPVGRWCREALFFLVWSCPQGVVQAQLCELAGLA